MAEPWPRTEKPMEAHKPKKRCCICRKEIEPGEKYHYVRHQGLKHVHETCFKEEPPRD